MNAEAGFATLKEMHADARLLSEGGQPAVLLPAIAFRAAGQDQKMDLLLIPRSHSGYATRLFFEQAITERGKNWKEHLLLERAWWAPSFKDVTATLPWRAMVFAHLRAVV